MKNDSKITQLRKRLESLESIRGEIGFERSQKEISIKIHSIRNEIQALMGETEEKSEVISYDPYVTREEAEALAKKVA